MATYHEVLDEELLARLRQFVRRRVRTPQGAEDVVQEAILTLLRTGRSVPLESARAWLSTVARRSAADRWRARTRTTPLDGEPVAPSSDRTDAGAAAYLAGCLEPMLATLPAADQTALRRVDIGQESQSDLARELGVAASTLKSRVQRARRRLRELLEGCCAVDQDRRGTPIAYRRRPERRCPCPPPTDAPA